MRLWQSAAKQELTTQSKPKAATHWSTRTMAAELGVGTVGVTEWGLAQIGLLAYRTNTSGDGCAIVIACGKARD